jgi:hypothetical protein
MIEVTEAARESVRDAKDVCVGENVREHRPSRGAVRPNWGTPGDRVVATFLGGLEPDRRRAAHARPRRLWIGPRAGAGLIRLRWPDDRVAF